jgi:hypothetical protein
VSARRSLGLGLIGLAAAALLVAIVQSVPLQLTNVDGRAAAPALETPAPRPGATGPTARTVLPLVGKSTPAPPVTASLARRATIENAYLRYWDYYSDALFHLDITRIPEVAAGEEVQRIQEEVEGFRRRDRAVRVRVSHRYTIGEGPAGAWIRDEITDRSFTIDPRTKQPSQGPGAGDVVRDLFLMKEFGDSWKVIKTTRERG